LLVNPEDQPDTEVRPQIQLDNEVRPHSPINEHEVSPVVQHDRSDCPPLRILYLLEIGGGIPPWDKVALVLNSREVNAEESLDDIFKSKRRSSCALP